MTFIFFLNTLYRTEHLSVYFTNHIFSCLSMLQHLIMRLHSYCHGLCYCGCSHQLLFDVICFFSEGICFYSASINYFFPGIHFFSAYSCFCWENLEKWLLKVVMVFPTCIIVCKISEGTRGTRMHPRACFSTFITYFFVHFEHLKKKASWPTMQPQACMIIICIVFWAAAPKGTNSCRT